MGTNIFETLRQEQGDTPQRQITIFDQLRETGEREVEIKSQQGQQKTAVTQAISQPPQERTAGETIKDVGVSLLGGAADLVKAGTGAGNLATFGLAGKVYDAWGYDPEAIDKKIDSWYSKPQQEANKKVEDAEGFVGTAKAMIDNPSTIGHGVVETVPMMLAGGVIARGVLGVLGRVAPKLAQKTVVKLGASALGEGSLQAGSMFEDVRQQTGSVDTKKAMMSIASGIGTGAFNMLGGALSRKLGFVDVDSMLAGIQKETGKKVTAGIVAKAIVQGGVSEGAFEEMPQSAQETMWMNAATGQPIMQGVDKAMAQGGIIGGVMGGSVNAASMSKQAVSSQKKDSEGAKKNEAALKLQDQNLSTDDLRNIRDSQELQAEQGVDRDSVIGMLTDRARDTVQAATILENEPNPGPLTRAGKTGVKQEWAKHILDQQAQRNFDEKPVDIDVGDQSDPDLDTADQLATVLTSVEIESEEDRVERSGYAQQFLDDNNISDEAKEHFWKTGVPEHLGIKKPGAETEGPRQEEWEAQEKKALKYNQIKNKKPAELSPEEKIFMEEFEKGNESSSEYPGGPPASVDQVSDGEVKKHEAKVRQERDDWQKENKRTAFQKELAALQEETDSQDEVDTGVLALADPKIKKQAEKEADSIVRENPTYAQKEEIKKQGGLDIHQAKETWDESTISGLVRNYPGLFTAHVMNGPKPLEIDTAASDLGYESADAMIQAFIDAPTIKAETSKLIQQYEQEWSQAQNAQAEDESLQQPPASQPVTEQSPADFKILLDDVKARPEDYTEKDFDVSSLSDEQRKTLIGQLKINENDQKQSQTIKNDHPPAESIDEGEAEPGSVVDNELTTNTVVSQNTENTVHKPQELTESRKDRLTFSIKLEVNRLHPDGDYTTLNVPVDNIPDRIVEIANKIHDPNPTATPEEHAEYDAFIKERSSAAPVKSEPEKKSAQYKNGVTWAKKKIADSEYKHDATGMVAHARDHKKKDTDFWKGVLAEAMRQEEKAPSKAPDSAPGLAIDNTTSVPAKPEDMFSDFDKDAIAVFSVEGVPPGSIIEQINEIEKIIKRVGANLKRGVKRGGKKYKEKEILFMEKTVAINKIYLSKVQEGLAKAWKDDKYTPPTGWLDDPEVAKQYQKKLGGVYGLESHEDIVKQIKLVLKSGPHQVKQSTEDQIKELSDDDISNLFDKVDAEIAEEKKEKKAKKKRAPRKKKDKSNLGENPSGKTVSEDENGNRQYDDGNFLIGASVAIISGKGLEVKPPAVLFDDGSLEFLTVSEIALFQQQKIVDGVKKAKKKAKDIIKEGGIGANQAVKDALSGFTELFGGSNTLRSGLSFDEEEYRKAKPHFVSAWNGVKDVGHSVEELIRYFYDKLGSAARPYLERFLMDVRDGNMDTPLSKEKAAEEEVRLAKQDVAKKRAETIRDPISQDAKEALRKAERRLRAARNNPELFGDDIKTTRVLPKSWPQRTVAFSNFFYDQLKADFGKFSSITQARKAVSKAFGLDKPSEGAFRKAVDEAIEYAVVRISRDIVWHGRENKLTATQIFNSLVELYQAQPKLGTRTTESITRQAYSTPSPIAFLANHLAGMDGKRGQTVFEPTAGTGMLVISADTMSTTVNELDPTRAAILKDQGFLKVTEGSALENKPDKPVDVVIANPPFGKVKKEDGTNTKFNIDGFKTVEIDHAISIHALNQMTEDGKAVLIIGGINKQVKEEDRAKKYKALVKSRFFKHLYGTFKVTDHFTVNGNLYAKQGAAWPIDIIVIDGKGQSDKALPSFVAPPVYNTFEEIGERLNETETQTKTTFGVDATRREQEAATPVRGPRTLATGNQPSSVPSGTNTSTTTSQGDGASSQSQGAGTSGTVRSDEQTEQPGTVTDGSTGRQPDGRRDGLDSNGEPGAANVSTDQPQGTQRDRGNTGGQGITGQNDDVSVAGSTGSGGKREVIASQGQTHYKPVSKSGEIGTLVPLNMAHPLQVALNKLAEQYGSVDDFVVEMLQYDSQEQLHKALSAEQVDAVALAIDNLQKGNGFILGDQTGIGKGRVVASMMRYAILKGKTPVFLTEKQALYSDMWRDMMDIGFDPSDIGMIMQTNNDNVFLNEDEGVKLTSPAGWNSTLNTVRGMPVVGKGKNEKQKKIVFTTYDQLNDQFFKKGTDTPAARRQFLLQLVANEDVILVMDEAHNAGGSGDLFNLKPDKETGIVKNPRALFLRFLISQANGVVYSSATYAKNPEVMDLYSATDLRLGVGGNIQGLAEAIQQGGIPFQQITAGMLTEAGQYIRRERSFDGVTYTPQVMDVDTMIAEDVSAAMAVIRQFEEDHMTEMFEQDEEAQGSNAVGSQGEQAQTFTSLMHNVIDQMLLSLKVKPSVDQAIKILEDGRDKNEQVVLTVSNTMGTFLDRHVVSNDLEVGDEVTATFNDLLTRYLWNTRKYTTDLKDKNGKKIPFWYSDAELSPSALRAYREAEKMVLGLDLEGLPVSPIDYMLDRLSKAGFPGLEITGRDFTIDYSGDTPVLGKRDPKIRKVNGRIQTIKKYNEGKNRAIILNVSGATGISLHASERNPLEGQGKRTMIIVQAEKDINVHMQMLGRIHRTGQVITPAYIQAVANVPAEKKPAALLVAKMASLNANTTADADSLLADKTTVNFLNKYGDRVATSAMKDNPELNRLLGSPYTPSTKESKAGNENLIKKVTGRLPLLPLARQEEVYNALIESYIDLIAELDATGRNDLEAKTFDLDAKTVETIQVSPHKGNSPFEGEVLAEQIDMKRIGKPFTSQEVRDKVTENKDQGEVEAKAALEEFEVYREEKLADARKRIDEADTDSKRTAAQNTLTDLTDSLNEDRAKFEQMNDMLVVGSPVEVNLNMGDDADSITGVVIGKARKGNAVNPIALSSWKVMFAVADGIRMANLPLSRLATGVHDPDKVNVNGLFMSMEEIVDQFDQALSVSREHRWMITGNLFSGYSTFIQDRGQIVNFTRNDGTTTQGILMPVRFNPQERIDSTPVTFETADQAFGYMNQVGASILNLRLAGDLRIIHERDGSYRVATATAVKKAGRFFRDDRRLLDITGSFASLGTRMVTDPLTEAQAREVFALFQARGNSWFTETNLRTARDIVHPPAEGQGDTTSESDTTYGTMEPGGVTYEIQTGRKADRNLRDVRRDGTEVRDPTPQQATLFTGPSVDKKTKRKARKRIYAAVKHARSGVFRYSSERADTFADIAQIASPIMDEAQENNIYVMTDENHKPVAVLKHSVGMTSSATVEPLRIAGVAHSIPEVKHIWLAHNHPSGSPDLSPDDIRVGINMEDLLRGTGVVSKGVVVVTPNGRFSGEPSINFRIYNQEMASTKGAENKVKGITRKISKSSQEDSILNQTSLQSWVENNAQGESGFLLMDRAHHPVAFVPMTIAEMQQFRTGEKGSGFSKIVAIMEKTNASVVAIVTARTVGSDKIANAVKMFDTMNVGIVDAVMGGRADNVSMVKSLLAYDQQGKRVQAKPDAFLSQGQDPLPKENQADTNQELESGLGRPGLRNLIKKGLLEIIFPARAEQILKMVGGAKFSRAKVLEQQIKKLKPKVDAAYKSNSAKAEDLDAQLDGLHEELDNLLFELDESAGQNNQQAGLMDSEADMELDLASRYEGLFVKDSATYGAAGGTRAEKIESLRELLQDYAFTQGGMRSGITDEQVFSGAKDAYEAVVARREAFKPNTDTSVEVKYSEDGRIEGFYLNGKTYLVDGNIRKGEAMAVLAHELGVHAKQLGFKDTKQFQNVLDMLERRSEAKTAEGKAIREAMARIPKDTKPEHRQEEILAYLVTNSPEIGIIRRLFAQLKKFLVEKLGITPRILDNIDLQALALAVVKREATVKDSLQVGIRPTYAMQSGTTPTWYSALSEAAKNLKQEKGSPSQMLAMLKKTPGVKQEEIEWLGLEDFLSGKKSVTRKEIVDFVEAGGVQIEEVVKGGDFSQEDIDRRAEELHAEEVDEMVAQIEENGTTDELTEDQVTDISNDIEWPYDQAAEQLENERADSVRHSDYQLPGGENYKELLLTLPAKGEDIELREDATELDRSIYEEINGQDGNYISPPSHYDEKNILASVRFNERTDADGNRVLFLEEVQSDWHQEGLKRGYKGDITGWKAKPNMSGSWDVNGKDGEEIAVAVVAETPEIAIERVRQQMDAGNIDAGVPNAPFKSTPAWQGLIIKRMIRYAAENRFDKIAWTTGEQQADRYDLSKQITGVSYRDAGNGEYEIKVNNGEDVVGRKQDTREGLESYIGKELTQKIVDGAGEKLDDGGIFTNRLSGLDLKVGGEGMKTFYNKMLPNTANKLVKKMGSKVAPVVIPMTQEADSMNGIEEESEVSTNLGFPITPKMKALALGQGMPMFSRNPFKTVTSKMVNSYGFKRWFGNSKLKDMKTNRPYVFHHNSPQEFFEFDENKLGENTGHASAGLGFFFGTKPNKNYGDHTAKVLLRMEKPYKMSLEESQGFGSPGQSAEFRKKLEKQGYDGVIMDFSEVGGKPYLIVFDANQIKSAETNTGEFSRDSNDIRFSRAAKDNQAIRGAENLNAEKDGETSNSSLSHGEKLVAEIIRKLEAAGSPAVAAQRFNNKVLTESIAAYRKATEAIDDPLISIAEKQKFAAGFAQKLPSVPRAKLLQRLSVISRMKTEPAQQRRLDGFLKQANKVLTEQLRRDLQASLKKHSKPLKINKDKVARGRGYQLERDLKYIRVTAFQLDSPDAILAEEARLEALEKQLKKQLLSAKNDKAKVKVQDKIDETQSFSTILSIFSMIETQNFDGLLNARKVLSQILQDGRAAWRITQDTWRRRHDLNRAKAAEEITGNEDPQPESESEAQARVAKEQTAVGRTKESMSAIMNSIQSWELSLDRIAGKSGNKTLKSWLVRHFGSIAHKGTRDYEQMQMDTNDLLMNKAAEIFGVKPGGQLAKVFATLNKPTEGKIFFRGREPASMSPLQAAYWYQISLDKNNETMQATFEDMGVTDKTLKQIEKVMGKDLKAWADYLVEEFYQDFHDDTNDVYRQIYGTDLAKNKKYVPWKRKQKGKKADKGHEGFLAGMMAGTIKKGALRERVDNSIPFMTANLNDVLMQHVSDMNHFKAWAIPTKEINGTFNDAGVQGYIRQHYGASTLREVRRFQDHFVRSESELRDDMQWLDRWRGKITTAMIGANPTVFLKQLASIPAYATDISAAQWVKYTAQAMANPVKAAMILGESTMMKARYKKGFERDVANAMRKGGNDMVAQSKRISDKLMILTSLGDRIAITLGGYAVYKYHLEQNKKAGLDEKLAHRKALTSFEMATERSQQSGNVKDLGGFQRGTPLMKLFTMYMTAPASYSRQIFTAVRQAKENPVDSAKRLFIYGVILPSLFQAVADAFMIFGGDDEDEERFWKNQAKALTLAPFNGLPVIRTMMEGYANAVSGNSFYDDQYTPMMQAFTTSKDMVGNSVNWAKGGTQRIDQSEYLMRAMWDAAQLGGYATGIPVRPLAKVTGGIKDAVAGETMHPIRRSLGYSPYIVGEK